MWTPEQSTEIQAIAHATIQGIKTHAIPQGLQVQKGPEAIVEYLVEKVPPLIDSLSDYQNAAVGFRQHLPDLNTPRFQIAKSQSPYEYCEAFQESRAPPWIYNLTEAWKKLLEEPYKGVTADGTVIWLVKGNGELTGPIRKNSSQSLQSRGPGRSNREDRRSCQ